MLFEVRDNMFREFLCWSTTILLFIAAFSLAFLAWWKRYSKSQVKLQVKDYIHFIVPETVLYLIGCLAILIILHQGAQEWDINKLKKTPNNTPDVMPRFVNEDEWRCSRGIAAYDRKDYDKAMQIFGEIRNLSGPAYVRWKYYEAMSLFRKEQYRKIVMLNEPNPEAIESAISRFRTIVHKWSDDVLYPDAKYWYAQCLRFFKHDNETAFNIFQELLRENCGVSSFKWREDCIYYSALILLNKDDDESRQKAISMLSKLLQKYRHNLIEPVEMGQDSYRVYWVVKVFASDRGISELLVGTN